MSPILDLPPVIGHRGNAGVAPENTLAGIRSAHRDGASWVEFDVKLTADGIPILIHDERLGRSTDGKGKVALTSYDEIRKLDAGSWFGEAFAGERVPTLKDALALSAELGLGVNVELKPCARRAEETAKHALQVLAETWPDALPRPLVSCFDQRALAVARSLAPDLPRGCLVTRPPRSWPARVERLGCSTLNVSHRWIKKKHIEAGGMLGVPVLAYTVNDPVRALELWEAGVTAVFTDQVGLMMQAWEGLRAAS